MATRFGFKGGAVELATDDQLVWRIYWRGGVVPIASKLSWADAVDTARLFTAYVMAESMAKLS